MRALRLVLVTAFATAACSLIDPLDDLTGGRAPTKPSQADKFRPEHEAGTTPAPDPPVVDASADVAPDDALSCIGARNEVEPNAGPDQATALEPGTTCAVLEDTDDEDWYTFDHPATGGVTIRVDGSDSIHIAVFDGTESPLQAFAPGSVTVSFTEAERLNVVVQHGLVKTPRVQYALARTDL
jgi:hypothetical protein